MHVYERAHTYAQIYIHSYAMEAPTCSPSTFINTKGTWQENKHRLWVLYLQ